MKTLRDLNGNSDFKDVKVMTKTGVIGYIHSFHFNSKGEPKEVILTSKRADGEEGELYPQIVSQRKDYMCWKVLDNHTPVNCHLPKYRAIKYINNT